MSYFFHASARRCTHEISQHTDQPIARVRWGSEDSQSVDEIGDKTINQDSATNGGTLDGNKGKAGGKCGEGGRCEARWRQGNKKRKIARFVYNRNPKTMTIPSSRTGNQLVPWFQDHRACVR